jgi:transglutaminase-like putative cysteine protease
MSTNPTADLAAGRLSRAGTRVISCELGFQVVEPVELVLQTVAAVGAGPVVAERFDVERNGQPWTSVEEVPGPDGARLQITRSPAGRLTVHYRAEIAAPPAEASPRPSDGPDHRSVAYARQLYLRPSRYCPSDHLIGFAVAEFGTESDTGERVGAIAEWIRNRVGYVAGSSSVHDSAEDTLLTGMGTCRDFAHLGIALCRAVGIPARFASVYAPGLSPMDFHAVFETLQGGRWYVHDATDLAPRQSMVRIVTGRDAADTAFASILGGVASFDFLEVTATVAGTLPVDDPSSPFELP